MPLILVERPITPTNTRPGMIVTMAYNGKNYISFVINPNKKNKYSSNAQLHAYTLGGVNTSDFVNILINVNADLVIDSANKEIRTGDLSDSEAYEAKYVLRGADARPYRTFNVSDISNIKQIYVELPSSIDNLISGDLAISNKSSKRQLLACAEKNDIECIKQIPEVKAILNVTTSYTEQEILRQEAAEREKLQQTRKRPVQQVLKNSNK